MSSFLANLARRGAGRAPAISPRIALTAIDTGDPFVRTETPADVAAPQGVERKPASPKAAEPEPGTTPTRSSVAPAPLAPHAAPQPPVPEPIAPRATLSGPIAMLPAVVEAPTPITVAASAIPPVSLASAVDLPATPVRIVEKVEQVERIVALPVAGEPAAAPELKAVRRDPPANFVMQEVYLTPDHEAHPALSFALRDAQVQPAASPRFPDAPEPLPEPRVEVTIGRIEIHQPAPPQPVRPREPRGFDTDALARVYLNRRWY